MCDHGYMRKLTRFADKYFANRESIGDVSLAAYIRQRCVDEGIVQPTEGQLESVELSFDGEPN